MKENEEKEDLKEEIKTTPKDAKHTPGWGADRENRLKKIRVVTILLSLAFFIVALVLYLIKRFR